MHRVPERAVDDFAPAPLMIENRVRRSRDVVVPQFRIDRLVGDNGQGHEFREAGQSDGPGWVRGLSCGAEVGDGSPGRGCTENLPDDAQVGRGSGRYGSTAAAANAPRDADREVVIVGVLLAVVEWR